MSRQLSSPVLLPATRVQLKQQTSQKGGSDGTFGLADVFRRGADHRGDHAGDRCDLGLLLPRRYPRWPAGCGARAQPRDLWVDMADHRHNPDRRGHLGSRPKRPAQRRSLTLGGNHRRRARRDLGHVRDAVLPGLVASLHPRRGPGDLRSLGPLQREDGLTSPPGGAATVAKVKAAKIKARFRPWKSIFLLVLAVAMATLSRSARTAATSEYFSDTAYRALGHTGTEALADAAAVAFCLLAYLGTAGLAGRAREVLEPKIGTSHAADIRYTIVLPAGRAERS